MSTLDIARHVAVARQGLQDAAACWSLAQQAGDANEKAEAQSILEDWARNFVRAERIAAADMQLRLRRVPEVRHG